MTLGIKYTRVSSNPTGVCNTGVHVTTLVVKNMLVRDRCVRAVPDESYILHFRMR